MPTPQQNALDICTKLSAVPRRLLVPCASRVGSPKISISYPSANNIRIYRARARAHPARHLQDDEIRCRRPKKIIGDARFLFQTIHADRILLIPLFSDLTRLYYRSAAPSIMVSCVLIFRCFNYLQAAIFRRLR